MEWHIRISSFVPDLSSWNALTILEGTQAPAEPEIEEILSRHSISKPKEFTEPSSDHPRIYFQRSPSTGLDPLFTVKVPLLGFQYVMDLRKGVTQWFIEPIDKNLGTPLDENFNIETAMEHKVFSQELVLVPWKIENILVWLQRAYFSLPCQNIRILQERRDNYLVHILLAVGAGPNDKGTKFTRHFIAGGTKLMDVFEILGGNEIKSDYVFAQHTWPEQGEYHPLGTRCWYSEAVKTGITFRNVGWVGNFVWLLPSRSTRSLSESALTQGLSRGKVPRK